MLKTCGLKCREVFQNIGIMLKVQNCLAQNGEVMLNMHKLHMHRMWKPYA